MFDSRPFMLNKIFLKRLSWKLVAHIFTLLLAPFASRFVDSRYSESLNIRKNSEFDDIFLQKRRFADFQIFFKDSLCLEWLTNLDAKGAKRSVKMWTTNFHKSYNKNILLYTNVGLSKIRSVHTYVMTRTVYFDWICRWPAYKEFWNILMCCNCCFHVQ